MIRSIITGVRGKQPNSQRCGLARWAGLDWYGRRESQIGGRFQERERYHEMKSGDYLLIKIASIQPAWISISTFFRNPQKFI